VRPQVPEFRASKFKVTNGEFAAFVRSQGYQTRKWWSEEGWGWRTFRNVKWPTFWVLGEWTAQCRLHCSCAEQAILLVKLRELPACLRMQWHCMLGCMIVAAVYTP
jgi:hypothetical protein